MKQNIKGINPRAELWTPVPQQSCRVLNPVFPSLARKCKNLRFYTLLTRSEIQKQARGSVCVYVCRTQLYAFTTTLLVFLLLPKCVYALGISVIPSDIHIEARQNKETVTALTVQNPSNETAIFEVYPDDFYNWIRVEPKNFILENKQKKIVTLRVVPQQSGVYSADISVTARSLSAQSLRADSGIKVPFTLTVVKKSTSGDTRLVRWVLDGVLIAGAVTAIFLKRKRKRII